MPRKPADWMVPLDERIMELLRAEGWSAPRYISRKTSLLASIGRVRERCLKLTDAGMVEPLTPRRENFDITGIGVRYLNGRLDASRRPSPGPNVLR